MFIPLFSRTRRIHLDYAATTPVHPEVYRAMEAYFSLNWANPSALYREGVKVRRAIQDARTTLARMLHVRGEDITYTSGGTESNNLAIIGVVESLHKDGLPYSDMEIISTELEHASIGKTLDAMKERGVSVVYIHVDGEGRLNMEELRQRLNTKTRLCTFAYVNAETGVITDIKKVSRIVRLWNKEQGSSVLVHTDACQAPLWLSCALDSLGVDLLSLDAGKCYGPKGVGVLVHRHGVKLSPILYGGEQEGGMRPGTENVPLILGGTVALVRAQEKYEERREKIRAIRDYGMTLIENEIPGVVINGSRTERVANNINISLPGQDTEYGLMYLDACGITASTRSACGALGSDGSSVVRSMTCDEGRARSTLRFTLGETTTRVHFDQLVSVLKKFLKRMDGIENTEI